MTFNIEIKEEVIFKKGTRRCSGRIRNGVFLYYIPEDLKRSGFQKVITELRKKLLNRVNTAIKYSDYFLKNLSQINQPTQLAELAKMIYLRKYPQFDFYLNIKFRRQKTVMGTYRRNKTGNVVIYINDYLKNAPLPLLEYVVAHELSHHHYPGHDKNFYRELATLCPEYIEKKKLATYYLILKEAHLL